MTDKEFHARKMVAREITDENCNLRAPNGARKLFCVEGPTGATILSLTWDQACKLAAMMNAEEPVAA